MPNAPWHQTATVLHGEGGWRGGGGRRKLYVLFTRNNTSKLSPAEPWAQRVGGRRASNAFLPIHRPIVVIIHYFFISFHPNHEPGLTLLPLLLTTEETGGARAGVLVVASMDCALLDCFPLTRWASRCLSGSTSLLHGLRPRRFASVQLIGDAASSVRFCDCHCSKCKYLWQELLRQV